MVELNWDMSYISIKLLQNKGVKFTLQGAQGTLHLSICSGFIYNFPKLETTKVSFSRQTARQIVIHLTMKGICLSIEKE